MTDKVKKLFEVVIDSCDDLKEKREEDEFAGCIDDWFYKHVRRYIRLEHLLRTAEKRGKLIYVSSSGVVSKMRPERYILRRADGGTSEDTFPMMDYICTFDLSIPLSDQSPEVLEKIAEVVV
jgi:hypothetical protein